MAIKVDINNLISDYQKSGGKTNFPDSLKKVLQYAQSDNNLKEVSDLAYLLATAKVESDYSLQRWESDYLCNLQGKPYKDKPCDSALNYYRSTANGKNNYYSLGTDKNGLPYFGRGLIQLTGKSNYQKYGDLIGVDLINDGDKALESKNSYLIASSYLSNKRGGIYEKNGVKRNTFDLARDNDLTLARKSVNGGSKGLSEVNTAYGFWKNLLKKNNAKYVIGTNSNKKIWLGIGLSVLTIGVTGTLIYMYLKKKNKLPNFIKNINLGVYTKLISN
jgi:predicted chitinase